MSARERDAVAAILTDPENQNRSAEEVAELAIEALDEVRARLHRMAVVGQFAFSEAPETVHTAVLGPFFTQIILDDQERFRRALERPLTEIREKGRDFTWDPKSKVGRGRFMLAPAFLRPRDAWNFYRPDGPDPRLLRLQESMARWESGGSREHTYGPVCHCGTRPREHQTSAGPVMTGPCPVHGGGAR